MVRVYKNVLFDFDGTLMETGPAIFAATRAVMREFGIADLPDAELRKIVGPPLRVGFTTLLHIPEAQLDEAVLRYRELSQTVGVDLLRPFPGILELLQKLHDCGRRVGVVSAKVRSTLDWQMERFGFLPYIDCVSAARENGSGDKDELLRIALTEYGLDPADTVMVGDRFYDLEGANAVHIDSIGVLYGYGSREELTVCHPTFLAESTEELRNYLL